MGSNPKSYASELHSDSIEIEGNVSNNEVANLKAVSRLLHSSMVLAHGERAPA
jgi:hypothetical protein